jgi:hypothetical protein
MPAYVPPTQKPFPCALLTSHPLVAGRSLLFAMPFNEVTGLTGPAEICNDLISPTIDGVLNDTGTTVFDEGAPFAHAGRTTGGTDVFKWDDADCPTIIPSWRS